MIATAKQWYDWSREWSGSAFLNDEPTGEMTEAECKTELYRGMCSLGNHMLWLEDQLRATAPPAPSVAVKALADAYKAGFDASSQGYNGEVFPEYEADNEWLAQRDSDLSALSAQVQDVAGAVEAFDRDHPELYWHIAKGKITAGEPLYGAIITDLRGNELGDGESNVSAIDAFNIAVDDAALPAAPAKQEGKP
ncbi:hypothetical protein [Agrobacterium tumefaciens]|uniref:hypothetical protein n=1 Tax=Agrobacterium tumefaciens TaxID=358 RepID=UPI00285CB0A3|nr:hypothetical protein [Agrobacterium tumefaciens]MDR6589504.1 hypothetical protein [Agrobacterium tumefaciens]